MWETKEDWTPPVLEAVVGEAVLVDHDAAGFEYGFGDAAGEPAGGDIDQQHVVVGAAGEHPPAALVEGVVEHERPNRPALFLKSRDRRANRPGKAVGIRQTASGRRAGFLRRDKRNIFFAGGVGAGVAPVVAGSKSAQGARSSSSRAHFARAIPLRLLSWARAVSVSGSRGITSRIRFSVAAGTGGAAVSAEVPGTKRSWYKPHWITHGAAVPCSVNNWSACAGSFVSADFAGAADEAGWPRARRKAARKLRGFCSRVNSSAAVGSSKMPTNSLIRLSSSWPARNSERNWARVSRCARAKRTISRERVASCRGCSLSSATSSGRVSGRGSGWSDGFIGWPGNGRLRITNAVIRPDGFPG